MEDEPPWFCLDCMDCTAWPAALIISGSTFAIIKYLFTTHRNTLATGDHGIAELIDGTHPVGDVLLTLVGIVLDLADAGIAEAGHGFVVLIADSGAACLVGGSHLGRGVGNSLIVDSLGSCHGLLGATGDGIGGGTCLTLLLEILLHLGKHELVGCELTRISVVL